MKVGITFQIKLGARGVRGVINDKAGKAAALPNFFLIH